MRLQAYKQITNTLPNRGWGDFSFYQNPLGKEEQYGVFIKSKEGLLKLGFPQYINFSKRKHLKIDRLIITICIFVVVLIVLTIFLLLLSDILT